MTLEDINGHAPAHHAAQGLVDDLTAWSAGETKWSDMSHSLLISGEPGTGKSLLARAIAASADVPLIQGSFGAWQAAGHLGDMLRAMSKCFAEAISQKPCVLFVDEIDASGYRELIDDLARSLNAPDVKREASEALRGLISEVRKVPDAAARNGHAIELVDDLAGILSLGGCDTTKPPRGARVVSETIVAGARIGHCFIPTGEKSARPHLL